jgi:cyanophycinase
MQALDHWKSALKLTSLCLALAAAILASTASAQGRGVDYFITGSAADAAPAALPTTPGLVLMGGGTDVDAAFRWMITKAGGGDFVVLRAAGADGYNRYIFDMGGVDSVETLVVRSRSAASDPFVIARINQAEAIFIAGGDQNDYLRLWKGTPLHTALDAALARKVPLGGTSAGLAVLGEVDYSGANESVTSTQALADPYNRDMTLDRGFITAPGLAGTVADSHFRQRDRLGRLITFVGRNVQDGVVPLPTARGIGIDEATALVVDNGVATRLGSGAAYFVQPTTGPVICAKRKPLTFRNVNVERLGAGGGSFDLGRWTGSGTVRYGVSAESGQLTSSQPGGSLY